jgi:hypothetical protein
LQEDKVSTENTNKRNEDNKNKNRIDLELGSQKLR